MVAEKVFHDREGEGNGSSGGKNISPRDKVLTSSSGVVGNSGEAYSRKWLVKE